MADAREAVDVAVGVLLASREPTAAFLLTSRPPGKVYAGYWEFPGGKLEPGETVQQALGRELSEELGITIHAAEPWRQLVMDYPHARVRLHFCKVHTWSGELTMLEGQAMAWQTLPVQVHPVLPGTLPVLEWLKAERAHTGPILVDQSASAELPSELEASGSTASGEGTR